MQYYGRRERKKMSVSREHSWNHTQYLSTLFLFYRKASFFFVRRT